MEKFDFIIVGQGITGVVLSQKIRALGHSVLVFDEPTKNTSSSVAVGLFHPMSFKRSVYGWQGLETFRHALAFYQNHAPKFLRRLNLKRVFANTEEYNRWHERMGEKAYAENLDISEIPEHIKAPFGLGTVKQCAKLQVQAYLAENKKQLLSVKAYIEAAFPYDSVNTATNLVRYADREIRFDYLVFCEGLAVENNPWFSDLRFYPAKGDVLKISTKLELNDAINKRHFIAPETDGSYWLGASYNWKDIRLIPEHEAKEDLLNTLASFLNAEVETKEHLVGVRPASFDRKPFIGVNEKHPRLACLNGMGSKSLLLSPYCADLLLDHLLNGKEIPTELDIKRIHKSLKT